MTDKYKQVKFSRLSNLEKKLFLMIEGFHINESDDGDVISFKFNDNIMLQIWKNLEIIFISETVFYYCGSQEIEIIENFFCKHMNLNNLKFLRRICIK